MHYFQAQVHKEMVETTPSVEMTSAKDTAALEIRKDSSINITSYSTRTPNGLTHNSTEYTSENDTETNKEPATDKAPLQKKNMTSKILL